MTTEIIKKAIQFDVIEGTRPGTIQLVEKCQDCGNKAGHTTFPLCAWQGWFKQGGHLKDVPFWFSYLQPRDYARLARCVNDEGESRCSNCWRQQNGS